MTAKKFTGKLPSTKSKIAYVDYLGPNGHWDFPEQMGNGVGFVYVIIDTIMSKAYLGKKNFKGMGRLNKGHESDWKKYTSSSNVLNEHIKHRPRNEFIFVCLEQYQTKGALAYAETWSLCLVEAPTTDVWYNKLIDKVSWAVKEPVSERHKIRLAEIIDSLAKCKG